jgi:hypothetical protein
METFQWDGLAIDNEMALGQTGDIPVHDIPVQAPCQPECDRMMRKAKFRRVTKARSFNTTIFSELKI